MTLAIRPGSSWDPKSAPSSGSVPLVTSGQSLCLGRCQSGRQGPDTSGDLLFCLPGITDLHPLWATQDLCTQFFEQLCRRSVNHSAIWLCKPKTPPFPGLVWDPTHWDLHPQQESDLILPQSPAAAPPLPPSNLAKAHQFPVFPRMCLLSAVHIKESHSVWPLVAGCVT